MTNNIKYLPSTILALTAIPISVLFYMAMSYADNPAPAIISSCQCVMQIALSLIIAIAIYENE